jgi:hypothetical protein
MRRDLGGLAMARHLIVVSAAAGFLAVAGGCLIVSGKSVEESGIKVSATTLSQVQPGETTEAWLIAALGPPSARTPVTSAPEVQILRYDYTLRKSSGGTVFLIFAGESESETTSRTFFEVTNGVVSKYWTES